MEPLIFVNELCPYCGESLQFEIDCTIPAQEYIEDCEVCCKPISLNVEVNPKGEPTVAVRSEND